LNYLYCINRDEVTGVWRKLHNEERHDLYSSSNIERVMKSRKMIWAAHVVWMGEERGVYRILVGKPEENRHMKDPGVDVRIILRCNFNKWDVEVWTGLGWLRIETGGGQL
jgi:hypothetical protein